LIRQASGQRGTTGAERGRWVAGEPTRHPVRLATDPEGRERETDSIGSREHGSRTFYMAVDDAPESGSVSAITGERGADRIEWAGRVYTVQNVRERGSFFAIEAALETASGTGP